MTLSIYIDANCSVKQVECLALDATSQDSRIIQKPKPSLSVAQADSIGILLKVTIILLQENHIKISTTSTNKYLTRENK